MRAPRVLSYIAGVVLIIFGVLLFFRLPSAGVISAAGGVIVLIATAMSGREGPRRSVPRSQERTETVPIPSDHISPVPEEPTREELLTEQEIADGVKMATFLGAGMYYRLDNFNKLGTRNPLYDLTAKEFKKRKIIDQKVYEYSYKCENITFEEEPTNEVDPDAIKIIIDGYHVGYVKKGSTSKLRSILKKNIISVTGTAGGGNYKVLYVSNGYTMLNNHDSKHWLRIVIKYKEV